MQRHRRYVMDSSDGLQNASVVRRFIHKVQKRYGWAVMLLHLTFCLLEGLCIAMYAYGEEFRTTREGKTPSFLNYDQGFDVFVVQAVLSAIFTLEWLFILLSLQYRTPFLLSVPTAINVVTCFAMNLCSLGAIAASAWTRVWIPMFLRVWGLYDHLLQLLDYPQLPATDLTRETVRSVLHLVSVMITCVGLFQAVESFTSNNIHLFESTYFIVVTFGTIGYGDIFPTSSWSRLVTVVIVVIAVYKFPTFFGKLAELAQQRPRFTSFSSAKGTRHHVIVAGALADRDVAFFLNEFFSGARKYIKLKIVLLSSVEFSQETRLLVHSPVYRQRVTLVIGDSGNRADLERCDAAYADAIFHVNENSLATSLADYSIVMRAIAVHQFDPNLPQHVMLKRERHSKFISSVVSSIMEKERLKFTLLGMGAVLPGAIPLIVNFIRTCDAETDPATLTGWKKQNEWGMDMEVYSFTVPAALAGRPFLSVVEAFLPSNIAVIGLVAADGSLHLNPKRNAVRSSTTLIAIASSKHDVDVACQSIEKQGAPEEQALDDTNAEMMGATAWDANAVVSTGASSLNASFAAPPSASALAGREPGLGPLLRVLAVAAAAMGPANGLPRRANAANAANVAAAADVGSARRDIRMPAWTSPRHTVGDGVQAAFGGGASACGAYITLAPREAALYLGALSDHVVLVDLVSAQAAPSMSLESQHEAAHYQSTDLINVMRPIKLQNPTTPIVLLTRHEIPAQFERLWKETGCDPIIVVRGCGLNTTELRACNFATALSAVIFSTGESVDSNSDAMSMLVSFSIEAILRAERRTIPVVTNVAHIESLSLFPPYNSDDALTAIADDNFALEPAFIVGSSICSAMLDPALYQTYFSPQLLSTIDALIYGDGKRAPIRAVPVGEGPTTRQYKDVALRCVRSGHVPIGLHRVIEDLKNEELHGRRFMFTCPPWSAPVFSTDILYFVG